MKLADVKDGVYLVKARLVQYAPSCQPRYGSTLFPGTYLGKVVTDEVVAYKDTDRSFERIAGHLVRRLMLTSDGGKEYAVELAAGWSEFVLEHLERIA